MKDLRILALICIVYQGVTVLAFGSDDTIGTNGINSANLGLNGSGISIGQVEPTRPGLPIFDGASSNSSVVPTAVFEVTMGVTELTPGANVDDHAEQVAGIMISNDITARGVAPGASLYASAHLTGPSSGTTDIDQTLLTIQHVATQPDMRAVNHSWGKVFGGQLDGNSKLTVGLDWSASTHDVLHVVSGINAGAPRPIPLDNYNGMTIGISEKFTDGVYRHVAPLNASPASIPNGRTMIDLIAPGIDVRSTQLNNMLSPPVPQDPNDLVDDGTSFAAPHVTGTVALLQQHAGTRIGQAEEWNREFNDKPTAYRHEVMKAVLMNSADKFKDDGSVRHPVTLDYIPPGRLLGMERTVLKQNGTHTWFQSEAFLEAQTSLFDTPLDDQMGVGHLNAKRALQQFKPGEHELNGNYGEPTVGDVPHIGWDLGTISGPNFRINKYRIEGTLEAGQFFSATLAWDREVEFANDADEDGEYDFNETMQDTFQDYANLSDVLRDLDLYLVPAGTNDVNENDILVSESSVT